MKRVLLISPPSLNNFLDRFFRHIAGQTGVSIPLAYLSSYLRQHRIEVSICDANYTDLDMTKTLHEIDRIKPDILAISAMFPQISITNELLGKINPDIKTIIGGPFSVTPADLHVLQRYPNIKTVCRGEGEKTLLEFVNEKPINSINGLSYCSSGKIKQNPERELIKDLDELPYPAWDLMPDTDDVGFIISSRGCPFPCTFCTTSKLFGKRVRYHSSNRVINELIWLNRELNKKHIVFLDDCFILNRQRVLDICDGILQNDLCFDWDANARADLLDEEFLSRMYETGLRFLLIGVETGDTNILKKYKKLEQTKNIIRAFKLCRDTGVETLAGVLIGPYDTRKSILKTVSLLQKIRADIVVLQFLTPEIGTEIFEKMEKENRILTYDFDLYDHLHITYKPYNLSISEMRMWHTMATLWSNLRPNAVLKNRDRYMKILSFALNEIKFSLF